MFRPYILLRKHEILILNLLLFWSRHQFEKEQKFSHRNQNNVLEYYLEYSQNELEIIAWIN